MHIEDRGYQFADGVYEVCEIRDGFIIDETRHLDRLERSLRELAIRMPMGARGAEGGDSRGRAPQPRARRACLYAGHPRCRPTRSCFPAERHAAGARRDGEEHPARKGTRARRRASPSSPLPDNRWARVDIKSVGLLPNAIAKQKAKEAGRAKPGSSTATASSPRARQQRPGS